MSFILDALKKAERDRGRVPTLASMHGPARPTARPIALWAVGGILLAGSGLLIWLLWPSPRVAPPAETDFRARLSAPLPESRANPERKVPSVEPGDGPPSASAARPPLSPDTEQERDLPRQLARPPLASPRPIPPSAPESASGGLPAGAVKENPAEGRPVESKPIDSRRAAPAPIEGGPAASRPAEPSPPPQPKASPGAGQANADVVVPPPPSAPARPPALGEAMAKMTLDVFVYTAVKTDRMVVINGRRYVEGQYVDGLYLLESITPEGAVLSYQGEHALLRP